MIQSSLLGEKRRGGGKKGEWLQGTIMGGRGGKKHLGQATLETSERGEENLKETRA